MQVVLQQMITPIVVESKQSERITSIYLLSFIQVFFSSLLSISIPTLLIFTRNISPEILGIATSAYAFSYLAGPLILRKISQKLGPKRSLLIITSFTIIYLGIFILTINPVSLLIFYILDGLFSSIFWSNMNNAVSRWQKGRPLKDKNKYFRRFSLSWNLGAIFGEITGFIVVFIGHSDFVAIFISWGILFLQIPLVMRFSLPKIIPEHENLDSINPSIQEKSTNYNHDKLMVKLIVFPVSMMLIGELLFQVTKGLFNFVFPFIAYSINMNSYWIYLLAFFQQISQIGAIYISGHRDLIGKFRLFMLGIFGILLLTIISVLFTNIMVFIVALASIGFFTGLLYGFSAQLQMNYSAKDGTLKYASMYESVSGAGFGLTPLIAGLIIQYNMHILFYGLIGILIIPLCFGFKYLLVIRNKKQQKKFKFKNDSFIFTWIPIQSRSYDSLVQFFTYIKSKKIPRQHRPFR